MRFGPPAGYRLRSGRRARRGYLPLGASVMTEKAKGRTDRFDASDGHEDEQQLGDVVLERVLAPLVLRLNDRRQEHDDAERSDEERVGQARARSLLVEWTSPSCALLRKCKTGR